MNKPIIIKQSFNSALQKVWEAITDIDKMRKWYFPNIPSFKSEVGFKTSFKVFSGDRIFTHQWKILEVILFKKIKYHWSYKEYSGDGIVTFELFEEDDQTLLQLTNEGLENFPQNIPEFTRESCTNGWNFFIKKNLKEFLD